MTDTPQPAPASDVDFAGLVDAALRAERNHEAACWASATKNIEETTKRAEASSAALLSAITALVTRTETAEAKVAALVEALERAEPDAWRYRHKSLLPKQGLMASGELKIGPWNYTHDRTTARLDAVGDYYEVDALYTASALAAIKGAS